MTMGSGKRYTACSFSYRLVKFADVFVVNGRGDYTVTIKDRKVGGKKEDGVVLEFKRKK
jgi:hypothetical protein